MNEAPLRSIGKVIQWATNQQLDLMSAYEKQWGFASKAEVWSSYTKLLTEQLPDRVDEAYINKARVKELLSFLADINQPYHLEMSSDEMAHLFLDFLEKN
ncbi:MAG: hypothetical protein ACPG7X_04465 [Flavobacteriaceae bacterium]